MPTDPGINTPSPVGPILIGLGALMVLAGLAFKAGLLSWFGRLPGDIRYETDTTRVYVPLVSMLLISIALSLIAALVRRFF